MYFSRVSRQNDSVPSSAIFAAFPESDESLFVSLTPVSWSRKRLHDEASTVESTGPSAKRRIICNQGTRGSHAGESSYYVIAPKPALPPIPEELSATFDAGVLDKITGLQNSWQQEEMRTNDTNPEPMPLPDSLRGRMRTEKLWTVIAPMALFPAWHTLRFTTFDPVDTHYMLQAPDQKVGKQPRQAVEHSLRLFATILQDVANDVDPGCSQTERPEIDAASRTRHTNRQSDGSKIEVYSEAIQPAPACPVSVSDPCCVSRGALCVLLMNHFTRGLSWMKVMEKSKWKGNISSEALALIATHPTASSEQQATSVITRVGLVPQWKQEIQQFLNWCKYQRGIYIACSEGATGAGCFHALNQYNIVLTTYGVITAEIKADPHAQAFHMACSQIHDLNAITAQQGLMRAIMPSQMKASTIHGRLTLQLPVMKIQYVYMRSNHEEQIVYNSLQRCKWVHFYQYLDGMDHHCNKFCVLGLLGSYTDFEKLAHSFLASNTVLAPSGWPQRSESHEHWAADALQFSEVEVICLPNHQSIWECPTYTTGLDNPIMSTPGSHGALLGEYHSQITHPALLTEQKTGGTDGTLCLYSWEIIDPAKPTD